MLSIAARGTAGQSETNRIKNIEIIHETIKTIRTPTFASFTAADCATETNGGGIMPASSAVGMGDNADGRADGSAYNVFGCKTNRIALMSDNMRENDSIIYVCGMSTVNVEGQVGLHAKCFATNSTFVDTVGLQ